MKFIKNISEEELEQASYGYLMQLLVVMVGAPIPVVNLIGSVAYWIAKRKTKGFVKWHATQALVSQIPLYIINVTCFWWTIRMLMGHTLLSSAYFAYLFTIVIFNIVDYVFTIYAAIQVRKGYHVRWYAYGTLTDLICGKI